MAWNLRPGDGGGGEGSEGWGIFMDGVKLAKKFQDLAKELDVEPFDAHLAGLILAAGLAQSNPDHTNLPETSEACS